MFVIISQVPDIKSSLAMITKLREKKEVNKIGCWVVIRLCVANSLFLQAEATMETQFLLSEQVYARAKVVFSAHIASF